MGMYTGTPLTGAATLRDPRPAIDDQFWFDQSRKIIDGGPKNRIEAAANLQKMIGWFWSVYTAGTFLAVGVSDVTYSLGTLALIIAPSPILVIGYWLAVWARMPASLSFDPRSPDDIRLAYMQATETIYERMNIALACSLLAAILVSVALLAFAVNKADFSANTSDSKNKAAATQQTGSSAIKHKEIPATGFGNDIESMSAFTDTFSFGLPRVAHGEQP